MRGRGLCAGKGGAVISLDEAASIGIIGGADGPTAIFVKGGFPLGLVALLAVGCVAALGIWLWHKNRE